MFSNEACCGAPSPTARNTVNFLHQENVNFIEPEKWPPNSSNLNPVDYVIWGALQEKSLPSAKVYHNWAAQVGNKQEVEKSETALYWQKLNRLLNLLENIIEKQGGHIEHVFRLSNYLANDYVWQNNYINLIVLPGILNNSYGTRGSYFLWPTLYIYTVPH